MPKNTGSTDFYILVGCIGGLFFIANGLAFRILNNVKKSFDILFFENKKMLKEFSKLQGKCEERHKR